MNLGDRDLDCWNLRLMLKISYAGCLGLSPAISSQLSRVAWKRLQIGTDMLLIITSTGDKLFIGVDDFEWPWTSKIGFLVIFLQFSAVIHILRVNCAEMGGDGTWITCVFSVERTFLRAKAAMLSARLSYRNSVRLSVRSSVYHTGGSGKNGPS